MVTKSNDFRRPGRKGYILVEVGDVGSPLEIDVGIPGGPANNMWPVVQVRSTLGVEKVGFKTTYDPATGLLTIEDDGAAILATDDQVSFVMTPFTE